MGHPVLSGRSDNRKLNYILVLTLERPMKPDQPFATTFAVLILRVAGLLLLLGVLIDYVALTIPPNFLNSAWLSNLISEWVGRGTIPLIGLALILFSLWIEQSESNRSHLSQGWLSGTLTAASVLGVLFLLLAPIYFRSNQLASAAETRRINQEAAIAEERLNVELEQQRDQLTAVLSNQELLAQVEQQLQASSGELGESTDVQQNFVQQIQETLAEVRNDPNALEQKIAEARQEGAERIQAQQQEQVNTLTTDLRKSRARVTLNSLFLAIGYLVIAGKGLGWGQQRTTSRAKQRSPKRSSTKRSPKRTTKS
ncbi:HpsJ family protein [Egbenema bharatensis]|uniref:HpsJ family protein n=1 Tax=Egbenema bharatensis TaxID=3463334 RepID=UPI003A87C673